MEAKDYWGYWISVVQDLRVKLVELEKRVKDLEKGKPGEVRGPAPAAPSKQPTSMAELASAVSSGPPLNEKELTGCMALKELGRPATIEEVNDHLKSTRRIDESMKETLFVRLRGAIEKGYVGFDQKEKMFSLIKTNFTVE